MPRRNTIDTYGSVAKSFHWLMVLLIVGMLTVGLIMVDMENSPDKFKLYGWHKSVGALILVLAIFRLAWRLTNIVPPLPAHMKRIERFLADASHWALYGFMFAMPMTGWLMSSAFGFPVSVFGLFTLPNLIGPNKELAEFLRDLHGYLAYGLIALVTLHALAAFLHHFYHRDNVLRRMLPFTGGK